MCTPALNPFDWRNIVAPFGASYIGDPSKTNVYGVPINGQEKKQAEISTDTKPATPPLKVPTQADASVQKAGQDERRRLAALGSNITTSSRGLGGAANTTKKTLLGQ